VKNLHWHESDNNKITECHEAYLGGDTTHTQVHIHLCNSERNRVIVSLVLIYSVLDIY